MGTVLSFKLSEHYLLVEYLKNKLTFDIEQINISNEDVFEFLLSIVEDIRNENLEIETEKTDEELNSLNNSKIKELYKFVYKLFKEFKENFISKYKEIKKELEDQKADLERGLNYSLNR